jgi:hypothetical protein
VPNGQQQKLSDVMRFPLLAFASFLTVLGSFAVAQTTRESRDRIDPARPPSQPTRSSSGKGPLPDPVLLDGSALPPEKRPEFGMLGEFEIPGGEQRSDKVGGDSNQPPPPPGGGGAQSPSLPNMQGGGGGKPQANQAASQGGGAQSSENSADAKNGGAAGAQGANGKAEGMQIGELKPNGAAEGADGGGEPQVGEKPPPVALGDSAMQIRPSASAASAVGGSQPAGNTQQNATATAGGGKQGQGQGGSRGGAVEKGRAMPSGL